MTRQLILTGADERVIEGFERDYSEARARENAAQLALDMGDCPRCGHETCECDVHAWPDEDDDR